MGELGAFLKIDRARAARARPAASACGDFREFVGRCRCAELRSQGARCMECGVPFCHNGCPLGQPDPGLERPRLPRPLARGDRPAARARTTSRSSPAGSARRRARPRACSRSTRATRSRSSRSSSRSSTAPGTRAGSCRSPPARRDRPHGRGVGSGPAGLAAAQQLRRAGHRVDASSSATRPAAGWCASACRTSRSRSGSSSAGCDQLRAEGVEFRYGVDVGVDVDADELRAELRRGRRWRPARACRATCRCPAASSTASTSRWSTSTSATARSRARSGRRADARRRRRARAITAAGKHVIVIGGGDTGADCVAQRASARAPRR